jgi:hypothetical protein
VRRASSVPAAQPGMHRRAGLSDVSAASLPSRVSVTSLGMYIPLPAPRPPLPPHLTENKASRWVCIRPQPQGPPESLSRGCLADHLRLHVPYLTQ